MTGAALKAERIRAVPPCPLCGKPASLDARPFCSRRCADIDLHRWLSEAYVVPVLADDEESLAIERPPDPRENP